MLNRENITVVWFDSMTNESKISSLSFIQLREMNDYILFYTQKSLYLEYLMSKHKRDDHVIVILNNCEVLEETHDCEEVHAILLITSDNDKIENMQIKGEHTKVVGTFKDQNSMFIKLQQVIVDIEHQALQDIGSVFSTFNRNERILQDVRHEFALFMWRQVFKSESTNLHSISY